jgi:hypothetical protein
MTHEFEYKKLPPMSKLPINVPFCMDKETGMSKLYQRKKGDSQKVNSFEELLKGLEKVDWPERAKTMQRNWIGKSEGAEIIFEINI